MKKFLMSLMIVSLCSFFTVQVSWGQTGGTIETSLTDQLACGPNDVTISPGSTCPDGWTYTSIVTTASGETFWCCSNNGTPPKPSSGPIPAPQP